MKKLAPLIGVLFGWFGASFADSRWGSAGQAVFIAAFVAIAIVAAIVANVVKLRRSATNTVPE